MSLSLYAVRVLREPFLKVEDLSRLYRPLILEMKRWPRPLCHASHKASPFDPPQPTKSLQETKPTPAGMSITIHVPVHVAIIELSEML